LLLLLLSLILLGVFYRDWTAIQDFHFHLNLNSIFAIATFI